MIYLVLSILASVVIFTVFKLFSRYNVNIMQAIVVNYVVACTCGLIAYKNPIHFSEITTLPWFYYTAALGALFITVFNLMAITTQRSGLSVVSVATKMSLVIPIVFGLLYYKESLGLLKFVGIVCALLAVYLASIKSKDGLVIKRSNLIFPLLVFVGSGIIDTSIKYLENSFVAENDVPIFSATVFGSAAIIGILILVFLALRGKLKLQLKNVIGGIVLGIPNYFSVYFLVKALRSDLLDSSGIFTVNNVAIVMISTLVGILLFKEKLLPKNWIGILLAVLSIFLVTLSGL
ncbi:EamA-like transporter family protein [Ulvibacter sp. MAR_2010_11]|uniref:DMT family transporter n=1 Tax=Ulvibacter sp. MAR_2010_11 TaxID=1250229 RepID=UPI000C2C8F84|nr:DMT family transporter [Ulvibacter sp. MAR_2010_11]PKA81905.1 EamA-like transporter family protein [Ulvibacter sp. MAR_2010_11]